MTARLAARVRIPAVVLTFVVLFVAPYAGLPGVFWGLGIVLVVVGLALYFRVGTVKRPPIAIRAPVTGQWSALNSPADKVPSHGLHAYGQTYAIDLVHAPDGKPYAPQMGWSPVTQDPRGRPGFGRPVVAPADGTVARVHDRERDHRTRASWPGLLLWVVEGFFRELTGPDRILGNHVTIEVEPGAYAVVAHLQRGSVTVRPGDRVAAGQPIAACGNSGSSTDPHVHVQVMDRPRALFAAGLPIVFPDGELPRTGEVITA